MVHTFPAGNIELIPGVCSELPLALSCRNQLWYLSLGEDYQHFNLFMQVFFMPDSTQRLDKWQIKHSTILQVFFALQ